MRSGKEARAIRGRKKRYATQKRPDAHDARCCLIIIFRRRVQNARAITRFSNMTPMSARSAICAMMLRAQALRSTVWRSALIR